MRGPRHSSCPRSGHPALPLPTRSPAQSAAPFSDSARGCAYEMTQEFGDNPDVAAETGGVAGRFVGPYTRLAAEARFHSQLRRCINIRSGRRSARPWSKLSTVRRALDNRAPSRRYLKSVSGVSDVAIRAFGLRRRQCYLKRCVRRSRRGVTHLTCANPLLADALCLCSLAQGPRERHVCDAKQPSDLGISEMDFR
jgi:hypothetical protein